MMRPQLNAPGDRVRLPAYEAHMVPLLDALAVAYYEDPETVGPLLKRHAANALRHDFAEFSATVPERERQVRAAEADGSRDALCAELDADVSADPQMTADDAITLATRLTRLAARIRHTSTKRTTP
ncbi:hypothetical protein OG909_12075 [Streptomyces sp. NBC_01754]|uniref:hypothetical protein n=1 Tax=Streptomyces sp. NBC_01754 TaxID=2975930 RepID=UPI002DDB5478|nr:hypothetical protein [Streptomyces sp. NBC_01754]WSC92971.1 hypothetical protein OG909_12075 [Streptomyces sp. NBC_01754]